MVKRGCSRRSYNFPARSADSLEKIAHFHLFHLFKVLLQHVLFLFFRKKVTFKFSKVVLDKVKGGFDVVFKTSGVVVILKTTDPLYTTLIKKDLRQMGASCKEQLVFNVY